MFRGHESPLLERDDEVGALTEAAQGAAHRHGRVIVVAADAGLGKTRLLSVAADAAAAADMRVLRGRGAELERGFPFGVALQLLRGELEHAERQGLLSGIAALAAPLLEPGATPQPAAVDAIVHGLSWVVTDVAEGHPVALIVDDAHWADAPSLRLLTHLANRVHDLPLLLVVATRPNEPGADAAFLPRLLEHGARRLAPPPLSAGAVAALVGDWSGSDQAHEGFVTACMEVTGGNPLLVRELLAALGEEGVEPDADGASRVREVGPEPVSRAVTLALERVGPPAAALVRAAAVVGVDGAMPVVAALAETDLGTAETTVASLELAGLLTSESGVSFVHPIVRAAVYEGLAPAERGHLHRKAATVLHERAPAQRVAVHLLAAPPAGEAWAAGVLRDAARDALARGAPATAVAHLRRALEEPPAEADRPALLAELGRAEAAAGMREAATTLQRAADAAADRVARAQLLLDAGRVLVGFSEFGAAVSVFERGEVALDGRDEALALELEAAWAATAIWIPEIGTAVMDRVAPLLAPGAQPRVHGERVLLATLAGVEVLRECDREAVLDWARRAWGDGALLEGTTADDPVFPALTAGFGFLEAFEECEAVCDAIIADARRRGSIQGYATGCFLRGGHYLNWGRVADAVADLEQAMAARESGWAHNQYIPRAAGLLIWAQLLAGNADRAGEIAEELPALEAEYAHSILWAGALEGLGLWALHRGDAEAAAGYFRSEADLTEALGARNPIALPWRSNAALALARLGRSEEAVALCDEELAIARKIGVRSGEARALRVRGIAGGRDGREDLRAAVEAADASPSGLQRLLSRHSYGVALRAAGKRTEALDVLREALDLAEAAGADAVADDAREEVLALGARPRRARLTGLDSLTGGEWRVAQMAAAGKTNRRIAEDLFVTPKAVQWHLTNVYRKLGVHSREELAPLVRDRSRPPAR